MCLTTLDKVVICVALSAPAIIQILATVARRRANQAYARAAMERQKEEERASLAKSLNELNDKAIPYVDYLAIAEQARRQEDAK